MRNFGIHGHHGPYVPPYDAAAARRKRRNFIVVLNIIFWGSAIAGALIQWMP